MNEEVFDMDEDEDTELCYECGGELEYSVELDLVICTSCNLAISFGDFDD